MAKKTKFSQKTRHARRLYGVLASLLVLSALGMEGCSWDDNAFKDFVTQNGENYTVTKCPNTEDTQKSLSYIEYVAENGVTECHYNDCRKQDECCGIDDEILRRQFIEGFKYNLCPANYRCDYDNETTEIFVPPKKSASATQAKRNAATNVIISIQQRNIVAHVIMNAARKPLMPKSMPKNRRQKQRSVKMACVSPQHAKKDTTSKLNPSRKGTGNPPKPHAA